MAGSRLMRRRFSESGSLLSLIWYRRSINLAFMFHLHTNYFCFVLSHLSAFSFSHIGCILSLHLHLRLCFSTGLTRSGWWKCEGLPWLIFLLQTNVLSLIISVWKPCAFIYRSEVDLLLRSLGKISGVFSQLPIAWLVSVAALSYLSAMRSDSELAATFPSCRRFEHGRLCCRAIYNSAFSIKDARH